MCFERGNSGRPVSIAIWLALIRAIRATSNFITCCVYVTCMMNRIGRVNPCVGIENEWMLSDGGMFDNPHNM